MNIGFHEVGERFMWDGVLLEVVKRDDCKDCFFFGRAECTIESPVHCAHDVRNDDTSVIYKLVEQCKPKEDNNMRNKIYYADLTPCDTMGYYMEASFVPQFVIDDTKGIDTEPPIWVVQLATSHGWCIVAKWYNNGSTRIYGRTKDALMTGVDILGYHYDFYAIKKSIRFKYISEEDMSVFDGNTKNISMV